MKAVVLVLFLVGSFAQAAVSYPSKAVVSDDGKLVAVRGINEDFSNDLVEVYEANGRAKVFEISALSPRNPGALDNLKTVKFFSNRSIFLNAFNGSAFAIVDVVSGKISCSSPTTRENIYQAIPSADGTLVGVVTSKRVSIYSASSCQELSGTAWDSSNIGEYVDIYPIAMDANENKFSFWAETRNNGKHWNSIFTYEGGASSIGEIKTNLSANIHKVAVKPGTSEAWFFSLPGGYSKARMYVIDYKSGVILRDFHVNKTGMSRGGDIQFSADGTSYIIANGFGVGVFRTIDNQPIKFVGEVGCTFINPRFCTDADGMTATLDPISRRVFFAGNDIFYEFSY